MPKLQNCNSQYTPVGKQIKQKKMNGCSKIPFLIKEVGKKMILAFLIGGHNLQRVQTQLPQLARKGERNPAHPEVSLTPFGFLGDQTTIWFAPSVNQLLTLSLGLVNLKMI